MAIFRCIRSGNTLSLNRQDDIDRIRQQENYTEILHESKESSTQESRSIGDYAQESTIARNGQNERVNEERQKEGQEGNVLKRRGRGRQKH